MVTLPIRIWKELIFDVYMLSDKTKRITYITSISMGVDRYIIDRLCENMVTKEITNMKITKIKRIYAWELKKFVEGQDAVLVDMYKYFTRFFDDNGFLIPSLVNQVLNIDMSIEHAIKIDKNNLKRVRKYDYEISNDPGDLKFFYEKMYIPYAKRRYGDSADIESFDNIEKIFKNGGLVFVTLNGERISASLDQMIGDTYFLRKGGIIDDSFIKKGALVASYYFSILRAKDLDAKIVDMGRSRPFLLDGVLRHKNHWGARICEDDRIKRFIYLKNVLFEQPFIYIENKKLKAGIFSEDDILMKEYVESGLEFNIIHKGTKIKELDK